MKLPGRFEWKILGVVFLVAALSAGTAAYALRYALRGFTAFWHHEHEDSDTGAKAADLFRAYFVDRKAGFRQRTQELAARAPARMADLASVDGLLRARLFEGETVIDEWLAPAAAQAGAREAPADRAQLPVVAQKDGRTHERVLELTFGIPREMYDKFVELSAAVDLERQREDAHEAYVTRYMRDYLLFVLGLLAVVPLIGLFFARRATERLARLGDAARRVGAGDLSVRLAPTGRDELDDLARSFDGMVVELGAARSRLEYLQKVSAWQEVARRLAHEIKNPLTPIQLAVQELASKYRGDDAAYQRLLDTAVEILKEEITSLRRLVDDFSAFAKLPKVTPAPLDLGLFLTEFERLHPEWQPYLEVVRPGISVKADCDRTLFGRVLANLVENAVQAAEAAGTRPCVRLSVEANDQRRRARVLVDDNGPGVPAGQRQRIFDPYITSKPHGTGLGLAIVRKIVIDHGGDISVGTGASPLGGARFVVEVPALD